MENQQQRTVNVHADSALEKLLSAVMGVEESLSRFLAHTNYPAEAKCNINAPLLEARAILLDMQKELELVSSVPAEQGTLDVSADSITDADAQRLVDAAFGVETLDQASTIGPAAAIAQHANRYDDRP